MSIIIKDRTEETYQDRCGEVLITESARDRYYMDMVQIVRELPEEEREPGIEIMAYIDNVLWIMVHLNEAKTAWHKMADEEWRWLD